MLRFLIGEHEHGVELAVAVPVADLAHDRRAVDLAHVRRLEGAVAVAEHHHELADDPLRGLGALRADRRRDDVHLAVAVHVRGHEARDRRADEVLHGLGEGAVAAAEEHAQLPRRHEVGDREIDHAVAVEVGDGRTAG